MSTKHQEALDEIIRQANQVEQEEQQSWAALSSKLKFNVTKEEK